MEGYTLGDLREELQSVRGETRVKNKEEGIRNRFLQAALREIFAEHDWPFNRATASSVAITEDGEYEMPEDFSMLNGRRIFAGTLIYDKDNTRVRLDRETGKVYLSADSITNDTITVEYYIKAPEMVEDSAKKVYFPQPMLIAERAYVRLKTAYFPDEDSDKELARSKRALRELYVRSVPRESFTHHSWS